MTTTTARPNTSPCAAYIDQLDPSEAIWIGGVPGAAAGRRTFVVVDPATGEPLARVADGGAADASAAVAAAFGALDEWAATAPRVRAEILRRAFDLTIASSDDLAALITAENGKSLADARAEVTYAAEFFRWFSEEAVRDEGGYGPSPAGGTRTIVTQRPIGVAALVTPWNFPAAMATRKIAPALAAGCTVVLKPAEETPLTTLAIARILHTAGVPAGVVNLVPTTDAPTVVGAWMSDPRVRMISFTGSTAVGKVLLHQAADRVVNTSMELGGNAPFVVLDDADIDAAVQGAMIAKYRNGGQACTAANRFYIHADVVEAFTCEFGAAVEALRVGPAAESDTQIGPLISEKALTEVTALVDAAIGDGAEIAYQASAPDTAGFFYPPTVLRNVPSDSGLLRTEIFGPVAAIVSWVNEAELLARVNDTEAGLAAYIYSKDLKRALKLAEKFDCGMVGINRGIVSDPAAPFGGIKQSGLGREGAREGMREFQEIQYFSVDWS